jgi:uncharacterized membrane protein YfbV (UPF0208 family)
MSLTQIRKKIEKIFQENRKNFSTSFKQSFLPNIPDNSVNYFKNPQIIHESDWVPINSSETTAG